MLEHSVYIIWIVTTGLLVVIGAGLIRNGVFRSLPFFTGLIMFEILQTLPLAVARHYSLSTYFYAYWACEFVSSVLELLVLREILMALLRERPHWRSLASRSFQLLCAALVLFTVVMSTRNISADSNHITNTTLALERSMRVVQCGLLVFIILFSTALRLDWRHYYLGAAAGLGVSASCSLAVVSLRLYFGRIADQQILLLKPAGYLLAACVWTFYLWSSQTQTFNRREISAEEISRLGQWKEALARVRFS